MAASSPSIKGTSISSLIEDIAKLAESGDIPNDLLAKRLTDDDRALLAKPVNPAGWYDLNGYRRLSELLCEVLCDGEDGHADLLRERGAAAARRLAEAGIYQQMASVERMNEIRQMDATGRLDAYASSLKLITTLSGSILNFGSWKIAPDPDSAARLCIEVTQARDFPEVLAFASEGFINAMARMAPGSPDVDMWRYERVSDDLLRFRMKRDF